MPPPESIVCVCSLSLEYAALISKPQASVSIGLPDLSNCYIITFNIKAAGWATTHCSEQQSFFNQGTEAASPHDLSHLAKPAYASQAGAGGEKAYPRMPQIPTVLIQSWADFSRLTTSQIVVMLVHIQNT